jgi:MFS family permease
VSERRQPRRVVLAIILAGYLLVLIDVSILMAALPSIRADLGFSDTSLSWAQNAYTLTFGGLLLLGARAIIGGALTEALSWRYGFLLNVPIGLAAIVAAPRYLGETVRHAGRLHIPGALSSTFGAAALVFGIVHSADAGWGDDTTIVAVALGAMLIAVFVTGQARADQPLMPLRLFADRRRAGAYAARFLFNGVLVSFYFFMTQYLQGVSDYTPLEAGLAFLPVTAAAFAAATVTSRLSRRLGTERLAPVWPRC